jgi:hypothetical protein
VPALCRWRGIVIAMYRPDHPPPHFHALYAEFEARIAIDGLIVLTSDLPRPVLRDVLAWAETRRAELAENWDLCRRNLPFKPIRPPE